MVERPHNGAALLVEALESNGVSHVFCVPGESFLAVLDRLRDSSIRTVVCRHESGAAMMAAATGKLTGRPGIAFVTRGPGATNAAAGLHVAMQDSEPMILFVGQVERGFRGREAFQELDYAQSFAGLAKWAAEIDSAARVPELVSRAFHVAASGRPGPVILSLPEDMLMERADARPVAPARPIETFPGAAALRELAERLAAARRPIAILGGTRWSPAGVAAFQHFAEVWGLPVACSFRRQALFDHLHPNYAGDVGIGANPKLRDRIAASDLVLLVGGRFSEIPSQGYTLLDVPSPRQVLVHVHADAGELGRVYAPALAVHATPAAFTEAAAALDPPGSVPWSDETRAAHSDYLAWSEPLPAIPGPVQLGEIVAFLRARLPDAIVANGAGNYAGWLNRFWRFCGPGTQLAPTSGSMGFGLPAGIAAKLARPERTVLVFAGDGCFLMTGQELATAVKEGVAVVVVVVDNGIYGTIRMHQEREFPGRVHATDIAGVDFAALARAYGGLGFTVETTEEFEPAFEKALASGRPALIHVRIDPEAITPATTIAAIREAALKER